MGRKKLENKKEHVIKAYFTNSEYLHLKVMAERRGIGIPQLIRKAIYEADISKGSALAILDELREVREKTAQVCDYLLNAHHPDKNRSDGTPLPDLSEGDVHLFYRDANAVFFRLQREFRKFSLN